MEEQLKELENKYQHRTTITELEELKEKMIGLRLYVQCHGRSYIGTLKQYFKKSSRLWLERTFIVPSGVPITPVLTVLTRDIKSIIIVGVDQDTRRVMEKKRARELKRLKKLKMGQIMNENKHDDNNDSGDEEDNEKDSGDPVKSGCQKLPPVYRNCIRPDGKVIVDNAEDLRYCLSELEKAKLLSVVGHGFNLNRDGTLAWLSIADSTTIYHFDILRLGASVVLENGLKGIFLNETIEKIIHDARCLQDYFQHNFDVHVTNIFDTQAFDIYLESKKNVMPTVTREAQQIFEEYLNIEDLSDLSFSLPDQSVWLEQPLPEQLIWSLQMSSVLLFELRQAMLDTLLSDVNAITKNFVSSLSKENLGGHAPQVELKIVPEIVQKSLKSKILQK